MNCGQSAAFTWASEQKLRKQRPKAFNIRFLLMAGPSYQFALPRPDPNARLTRSCNWRRPTDACRREQNSRSPTACRDLLPIGTTPEVSCRAPPPTELHAHPRKMSRVDGHREKTQARTL